MGRVYRDDIIVEAEKKLVKITDADNFDNFVLINNQQKVKNFNKADFTEFVGGFKDGFVVSTYDCYRTDGYVYIRTGTQAYNYNFDLIAAATKTYRFNITDDASFNRFVKDYAVAAASEENCK